MYEVKHLVHNVDGIKKETIDICNVQLKLAPTRDPESARSAQSTPPPLPALYLQVKWKYSFFSALKSLSALLPMNLVVIINCMYHKLLKYYIYTSYSGAVGNHSSLDCCDPPFQVTLSMIRLVDTNTVQSWSGRWNELQH